MEVYELVNHINFNTDLKEATAYFFTFHLQSRMSKHRIVALNPNQRLTRLAARQIALQRLEAQRIKSQREATANIENQRSGFLLRKSQRLNRTPEQKRDLAENGTTSKKQSSGIDRIKQRIILRIFLGKQVSETHFV